MHKNKLWLSWLVVLSLITLWYAGMAVLSAWHYAHLTASTSPTAIAWSVKQLKSDDFSPLATYTFEVNGQAFQGVTPLREIPYRNSWGVEQDLKKLQAMQWRVWYEPHAPYRSTLQKTFPLKECLSALFLLLLWGYFVGLGMYIGSQKR